MLKTVVTLAAICGVVRSSGIHHAEPIANAPVVTAHSSQYFERTFNQLVAPPVLPPQQFIAAQPAPIPVQPVQHLQPVHLHLQPVPQLEPVLHLQQSPSVVPVQPVQHLQPLPSVIPQQASIQPTQPLQPVQPQPAEPNVAIAIATANAAAPVSTIFLPPYPFGFPPSFGFIPQEQPNEGKTKEETTTQKPTSQADILTTKNPEATTQVPDANDNNVQASPSNQDQSRVNFRQYLAPPLPSNHNFNFKQNNFGSAPLPSNQDINFRKYLGPKPQPQQPQYQPLAHHRHHHPHTHVHPKKLKTLVEVQKVPLAYIAPPPLPHFEHHNHEAIKVVKHVYSFVPSKAKLIIRPVLKTRSVPSSIGYKPSAGYNAPSPLPLRSIPQTLNARNFNTKEIEPTTFRPFPIPNNKPPRL